MHRWIRNGLVVLPVLAGWPAFARQEKPTMPNVLIVGDSIYPQHARGAINEPKRLDE